MYERGYNETRLDAATLLLRHFDFSGAAGRNFHTLGTATIVIIKKLVKNEFALFQRKRLAVI